MRIIIDAKYKSSDLNKLIAKQCQHLNATKCRKLLALFKRFDDLFGGMLGTRKKTLVDLKLNYDAKPEYSRPYIVPRVHKEMFKKETEILVKYGVIKHQNDSEWGTPYFSQSKVKTNKLIFLSDFLNLNRQLKRKLYPMSKYVKCY